MNKRQLEVKDLQADLADGLNLINLLELLSKESLPKYNKTPKIEIQKLENLNTCLKFITDHKVPLVNIGSKDIYSGNEKLILGLLWTLILRWEVSEEGKQGLLLWVQRALKGYRDIDPPNVQNFTTSWMDGLGFCGLIHHFRPDLINYDECHKTDAIGNCEKAFAIAEEKLGIARLLDAQDVVTAPDEKSIIAYVSQFFKLFAQASKNDALIKAIKNAIEITKRHDNWIGQYNLNADEIEKWARLESERLSAPLNCSTTNEVIQSMDSFKIHMKTDKPEKQSKYAEIEGVYNTLVNSKRNNKRPEFNPTIQMQQLQQAWDELEKVEVDHERNILDVYGRYQQVDREAAKFLRSANTIESWLDNNNKVFQEGIVGSSLQEIESNIENHENYERRLEQIKNICQNLHTASLRIETLSGGQHQSGQIVTSRMNEIDELIKKVEEIGNEYLIKLKNARENAKSLIDLKRKFNKLIDDFGFDIDTLQESADEEIVKSSSLKEVESGIETYSSEESKLKSMENEISNIESLANQIGEQEYIDKSSNERNRYNELLTKFNEKSEALKQSLEIEKGKESLRKSFAEISNTFALKCEKIKHELANSSGSLENQLESIRKTGNSLLSFDDDINNINKLSDECDNANIIGNPYTAHTYNTLKATIDQLKKTISEQESSINAQIMAKKALEVSPEQLKELADVFHFFDKDNTGKLGFEEVKEACQGAGIDLPDDEVKRRMIARSSNMEFTIDDFVSFMLEEIKKGDTAEDVLRAFNELGGSSGEGLSTSLQAQPDLLEYIQTNKGSKDFATFTKELFSR